MIFLHQLGVSCVFGPGTPIPHAAIQLLEAIQQRQ